MGWIVGSVGPRVGVEGDGNRVGVGARVGEGRLVGLRVGCLVGSTSTVGTGDTVGVGTRVGRLVGAGTGILMSVIVCNRRSVRKNSSRSSFSTWFDASFHLLSKFCLLAAS